MKTSDVAIIGAGPYGLSIAAHLRAWGVDFRIFGSPMHTWQANMPKGMRLKSEGFASCLYDPDGSFTLAAYCKEKGLAYADIGIPVPLETFTAYGLEFQKRFVPELENKRVVSLRRAADGYQIHLEDGEAVAARKVIVAVGLNFYEYIPPILSSLPKTHLSHGAEYGAVDHFKDREVVVVGAGASALDLAALLHQAGACVQVVARKSVIRFHDPPPPHPRSLIERLWNPQTGIGQGWKLFLCVNAPLVFRLMSEQFRLDKVRRVLGPAPGWFIKKEVVGKVPLHLGLSITDAKVQNGRVRLQLTDAAGTGRTIEAEHIIAATGYQVDLRRLSFLDGNDLAQIRSVENTPVLSSNFESSLSGLYFVGTSAANTFGPLLRFACGAKFTARRLARHLAKSAVPNCDEAGTARMVPVARAFEETP
ncbi:MAG TPA: NAD(P)-binding domain-containing protein [Candidatus Acidoferrum sp.]|jgi:hypothetical protein|nr:NAD(P)-binding domain-containing protein [Candidatus Acidoferrum sp.]